METDLLSKKKLLAPKLRFKGFLGEWKRKKLDEIIINLDSGVSVNSIDEPISKVDEHGILKTSCISFGKFYPKQNKKIIEEDIKRAKLNPTKGSILISRMNTPQLVGHNGYIEIYYPNLFVPDRLWMTSIDQNTTNSKLLSIILSSDKVMGMISNIATGTSGSMKNISKPNFLNLEIELPSLPEQQKIASFLSAVDEKIEQLNRKKELLEQYKKGVMQQLFAGKLRFKDENGKAFPKWDMLGGDKLFESISDKKHNSDLPILAITQDQGAIPREMINYQMIVTDSSIASYKVVQIGDFIISLRTFQGGIEYSNYKGICSPAYNILRPRSDDVNRDFYRCYLKTPNYIKQLQKNLEGIRDGKMISYKYFSEIKLPFPSKKEQIKIANYLSIIDNKIEIVNKQITQTQTFKKGLLQQMFV